MEYEGLLESDLPKFHAVLQEYCKAVETRYRDALEEDDRVATGKLTQSVSVDYGKISPTVIAVVLNSEDYRYYTEYGRNAGKMPPVESIRQWIEAKGILPRDGGSKEGLAWAIAKKIEDQGYYGRRTLYTTLNEINEEYLPKLRTALQEDFDDYCSVNVLADVGRSLRKVF